MTLTEVECHCSPRCQVQPAWDQRLQIAEQRHQALAESAELLAAIQAMSKNVVLSPPN